MMVFDGAGCKCIPVFPCITLFNPTSPVYMQMQTLNCTYIYIYTHIYVHAHYIYMLYTYIFMYIFVTCQVNLGKLSMIDLAGAFHTQTVHIGFRVQGLGFRVQHLG